MEKEHIQKNILIVGGGFAGINLALGLSKVKDYSVTLVDKNNYNYFSPLLYQLATGMLQVSSIALPFRTLFKGRDNLNFRIGELLAIDTKAKKVKLNNGVVAFDYLVIAIGTKTNFFGNTNIEKNALPMKTIDDAIKLRNKLLSNAEIASLETDSETKESLQNIVVAGGGPAGVEIAGMLAELKNKALKKLYPHLEASKLKIFLVEGEDNLLSSMRKPSQSYAHKSMNNLGIEVITNTKVDNFENDVVTLSNEQTIKTKTLIWTTGVVAQKIKGLDDDLFDKSGRITVNEYSQIPRHDSIFVIGDMAKQTNDPEFPNGYPQLGSVATQQGKVLAKNFKRIAKNRPMQPFKYFDKGTMAIIGKSKATADMEFPKKTLTGWFAWVAWLGVHLFLLINYRNRIKTMWEWTNSYLNTTEPEGLLIGKSEK